MKYITTQMNKIEKLKQQLKIKRIKFNPNGLIYL